MSKVDSMQNDAEIVELKNKYEKLRVNYEGMLAREKRYLAQISDVEKQSFHSELEELQKKYKGLLAREQKYLFEIEKLKQINSLQHQKLYQTYSYQLGFLLIQSTKSFSNFVRLPKDLLELAKKNKERKQNKKNYLIPAKVEEVFVKKTHDIPTVILDSQKIKMAAIMDEFTSLCFAPEVDLLQITPSSFKRELDQFKPDLVFIESAWQGKDGLWKLKVSQRGDELVDLIKYCRDKNIKTMFWNKEDPVHFGTFIEVAKMVDVVFTTDIDCIQKYKNEVKHDDVYLMPFAAQPKTHNPIEKYERKNKFNFAGSYYLKYPVRQRDFSVLTQVAVETKGLDIYDRNYNNPHPHYQFPKEYENLILGRLEPDEIDKAYKGYEFGINMNTIKQSQTMFARRVFEMLASNTVVFSNYSRGVRLLFGDLVVCSDDETELKRQLDNILQSDVYRKKFKLQGLRKVLSEHTYQHRLNYICEKLKIRTSNINTAAKVAIFAEYTSNSDLEIIINNYRKQEYKNKNLYLIGSEDKVIAEDIRIVSDISTVLSQEDITHAVIYNIQNIYGEYYLTDLVLTLSYLKFEENCSVTKDSYYVYKDNLTTLINGREYGFVESFHSLRTLWIKEDLQLALDVNGFDALINGVLINKKAFSADCFSFIENGSNTSQADYNLICENNIVDSGVGMFSHLIPVAENIKSTSDIVNIEYVALSIDSIESSLNRFVKLTKLIDKVKIDTNLIDKQHRLIKLAEINISGNLTQQMAWVSKLEYSGTGTFVFEFLDKFGNKIGKANTPLAEKIILDIDKDVDKICINLRAVGISSFLLALESSLECRFGKENLTIVENDLDLIKFDYEYLSKNLVKPKSKQIIWKSNKLGLEIKSTLTNDKHAYIYLNTTYDRSDINLLLNSLFKTSSAKCDLDLRTVFIFLDENHEKLSHSIIPVDNYSHAMAIPRECKFVRIGFKITGMGTALIEKLEIGEVRDPVNSLITKSDTLVLAKQYPSYTDLYKYGFLHSRLRAYKKSDVVVDMFRISSKTNTVGFSEFESIDIFTGNNENLREVLRSGQIKRVFVHILDKNIWSILEEFIDTIKIVVWVHGSEAQTWERRAYEFQGLMPSEIERKKKLSDQRKIFWQKLLSKQNPNLLLIFVSEYFKNEFVNDICEGNESFNYQIIHNYIDSEIFNYVEKKPEDVYKVLSIRPFSSLTYANDLTVQAILELSKSENFDKFQFTLVGDGELFDETVEPIQHFSNVILRKEFLTQNQIAELHKENGVFLVPTRMDTQGVSRGEAMSSGLVAVTNNAAAVPEFVSENDGVLVDMEDYEALAQKIIWLAKNPNDFAKLSINGRERAINQCGLKDTICKELDLVYGE